MVFISDEQLKDTYLMHCNTNDDSYNDIIKIQFEQ